MPERHHVAATQDGAHVQPAVADSALGGYRAPTGKASASADTDWLFHILLRFWASVALDPAGGYHERIRANGAIPVVPKSTQGQANLVDAYASALAAGAPDWMATVARHGATFLTRRCWFADNGGYVRRVKSAGEVVDGMRDLSDQAAAIRALAAYYLFRPRADTLATIKRSVAYLDHRFADPVCGGFHEAISFENDTVMAPRSAESHRLLMEAFMALYDATGQERWLTRVGGLQALTEMAFLDEATGTIAEVFDEDWTPIRSTMGISRSPESQLAWVSTLLRVYQRTGDKRSQSMANTVFDWVVAHGLSGGVDEGAGVLTMVTPGGLTLNGADSIHGRTALITTLAARASILDDATARSALDVNLCQLRQAMCLPPDENVPSNRRPLTHTDLWQTAKAVLAARQALSSQH